MPYFSQVALNTPFDNSVNGFTANNTQAALEEVRSLVTAASRAFTFGQYNGNANTGRYIEFFSGISSDQAPIRVIGSLNVLTIVARATSSSTGTLGFYNIAGTPTLLYTVTYTATTEVVLNAPSPGLFTLPANGSLAVKVDSGSLTKPHIYFTGQGG